MKQSVFKNPYTKQYTAPYRHAFFDKYGRKLGRVIWRDNVDGIYIDECDEEWGL